MRYSALQIAEWVAGFVDGDKTKEVTGMALIDDAKSTDLTYVRKQSDLDKILTTEAGIILVPPLLSLPSDKTYIKVACPPEEVLPILLKKFHQLLNGLMDKCNIHESVKKLSGSVIGNGVTIGESTVIGPNVVIEDGVSIGSHCTIYANAFIGRNVQIGSNVIIHAGAVIGSDSFEFILVGDTYEKLVNIGSVIIEDDVEIGTNTTIDKGTIGNTVIGAGTKIDNLVQIGHEVVIGKCCIIVAQVGIAGWTKIGNHTTIYGQTGVVGDIQIGNNVVVMGKSVVTKNIGNNEIISGNPAINHKENLKFQALLRKKLK